MTIDQKKAQKQLGLVIRDKRKDIKYLKKNLPLIMAGTEPVWAL